ncbi:bifunctional 3-deoxy-7-phosphoheptulonate synthase/chorismate mutase type II [Adhaeribacter soli]|uniref:chorismate mutase n=1 Tax=Adhaeribacter soli TaxID=2607655 RepID=A0A5N1IS48_9BACT|nr:bifunctional 3-deoxy-7-phosphoheptulonate synthase/chorismate mutase type II [Adhaeribacter soli]KAA9327329.1 3-deoxy-7-phosphoheptulonate synthase [Adhaeribacter soli]
MELNPEQNYFSRLLSHHKPLLISGPCSAESEGQVLETALALKNSGIDLFRAGIWKPRSKPGTFEGIGEIGLQWLNRVQAETGLPVSVEVATPQHIELALRYDMDVIWIGARTTVNPFVVQELAEALRGVDIPVMVKNPVNPDLALWAGALERFYNMGIRSLAAIHRGFSVLGENRYRNAPLWQIPIELKTRYKNLPLIVDPSHIGGRRDLILPLTQQALDLDYDGLMVEVHPNPAVALSDAEQQLTPAAFADMLASLKVRTAQSPNPEFLNCAEELRAKIDAADRDILEMLARRMALVEKIGEYKRQNNVTILQMDRWNEIFKTRPEWAARMGINPDFVEELYKLIHLESIRKQTEIMERD